MNLKKSIIAGVAGVTLVTGAGFFAYTQFTPKGQFLTRALRNQKTDRLTQSFELTLESGALPVSGMGLTGEATVDKQNFDMSMDFNIPVAPVQLPQVKFARHDGKFYVNADLITSFAQQSMSQYGMDMTLDDSKLKGRVIDLETLMAQTIGKEAYDEFIKEFDSSTAKQEAINKEVNGALGQFLRDLPQSKFKTEGDFKVVELDEKDIKNAIVTVFTSLAESKHYQGDKQEARRMIKELETSFDQSFSQFDLGLDIKLGQKTGDTGFVLEAKASTGEEVKVNFITKELPFKAPVAPTDVVSGDELQAIMNEIQTQAYASTYDNNAEDMTFDAEVTTDEPVVAE